MDRLPERIRAPRLDLRPFEPGDAPAVLDYSDDADWRRFQQTVPTSFGEARQVVDTLCARDPESAPAWAIELAGRAVGVVTLELEPDRARALLGYGIHRDHRGRGLTGEAIGEVLECAFSVHRALEKVVAASHAENHRSHRLLEKLGFEHEATVRLPAKSERVDGSFHGLLREQWRGPSL